MNKSSSSAANSNCSAWFPKEQQLDDSLVIFNKQICRKPKGGKKNLRNHPPTLPGHPTHSLQNSPEDVKDLAAFIQKEFITKDLNQMSPHLWLVATPNHSFVSPLHEQLVRGRRVIITENPELHLVWIDDKVFIKPIPPYLMSHAFWEKYLDSSLLSPFPPDVTDAVQPAILGFLRSWTYLVAYESDFTLAKESNLVPRGVQYARFMRFMENFKSSIVEDSQVSPRYRFGQLRLSRLNLWAKVFLGRMEFEKVHWQYWQYFQTFYGPLLFIFAVFTVVLSAMQVGLTAPEIWPAFTAVSIWFSVVTLLIVVLVAVVLVTLFLSMGLKEVVFATRAVIRGKVS